MTEIRLNQIRVMGDFTEEKLREGNLLADRMKGLVTTDVIRVLTIAFLELRRRHPDKVNSEAFARELIEGAKEADELGLT